MFATFFHSSYSTSYSNWWDSLQNKGLSELEKTACLGLEKMSNFNDNKVKVSPGLGNELLIEWHSVFLSLG